MTGVPGRPARQAWRVGRLRRDDRGQVTVWGIFAGLIVLILAGLVFDEGMAMADHVRVWDTAQAAARAGAREIDLPAYRGAGVIRLDPVRAATAARAFLSAAGATGTVSATTTTVTVTVHTTRHTQLLHLVGVTTLSVSATGTATPVTGVT